MKYCIEVKEKRSRKWQFKVTNQCIEREICPLLLSLKTFGHFWNGDTRTNINNYNSHICEVLNSNFWSTVHCNYYHRSLDSVAIPHKCMRSTPWEVFWPGAKLQVQTKKCSPPPSPILISLGDLPCGQVKHSALPVILLNSPSGHLMAAGELSGQ